jgi:hypothetical protein
MSNVTLLSMPKPHLIFKNCPRATILLMYIIIIHELKNIYSCSHVKMDFTLVDFVIFKSPLRYISFYEMTWKLAVMVHQHVIKI